MMMIITIPVQLIIVGNAFQPIVLLPIPDQLIQDSDEQPANALLPNRYQLLVHYNTYNQYDDNSMYVSNNMRMTLPI
jgi:hypothetical protein